MILDLGYAAEGAGPLPTTPPASLWRKRWSTAEEDCPEQTDRSDLKFSILYLESRPLSCYDRGRDFYFKMRWKEPMNSKSLPLFRGELALCIAVLMNSFGVVLMLYSGAGISAISSVPFAFSEVWPVLTLGTWTYLFQGCLVLSLMLLRKKFVPSYLFSFVVGFVFGKLLDVHEAWINVLPYNIPMRVVYFVVSYCLISLGIALSNRCKLPIVPTDLFPRELADITGIPYPKIKIGFDVICLAVTAGLTLGFLHHLEGLGIGTIAAAFTMGKAIGFAGDVLDKHFRFGTYKTLKKESC